MSILDWAIVFFFFFGLILFMLFVGRLNKSVADFVVANRCAGRYLICVAEGAAALGIMSFLGHFEQYYEGGFCPAFWWLMVTPLYLLITMSGWIIYRFRCTRAFTYAQFYEMRYSRNFRIFAGISGFVALMILYGLCPAIAARFLISFVGLPNHFTLGSLSIPTFPALILLVIIFPIFITMIGGQITVMVTDFLQGQIVQITLILVIIFLILFLDWNEVVEVTSLGTESGSLVNPFKSSATDDFNALFFFLWISFAFYSFGMAPTTQSFQASALNPHESQMARVWSILRNVVIVTLPFFIPIAAYTIIHHPNYTHLATSIRSSLDIINDTSLQSQVRTPIVLTIILPAGLRGMFLICTMATAITTDSTFMQSLGTIFTQDIVLPLKGRHLNPKVHMIILRSSMIMVGFFAFIFSMYFPQKDFLMMYLVGAMGIYLAGAGIVTIGGLYWSKGSTVGAWAAMATGMTLNMLFLILKSLDKEFPLNGMQATCISAACATVIYIFLSFVKPANHDLDKLLNRSISEKGRAFNKVKEFYKNVFTLPAGFVTFQEKLLAIAVRILTFGMLGVFVGLSIYNIFLSLSDTWWFRFWKMYLGFVFIIAVIVALWLLIGGIKDLTKLFKLLSKVERDERDDGFVDPASRDIHVDK